MEADPSKCSWGKSRLGEAEPSHDGGQMGQIGAVSQRTERVAEHHAYCVDDVTESEEV